MWRKAKASQAALKAPNKNQKETSIEDNEKKGQGEESSLLTVTGKALESYHRSFLEKPAGIDLDNDQKLEESEIESRAPLVSQPEEGSSFSGDSSIGESPSSQETSSLKEGASAYESSKVNGPEEKSKAPYDPLSATKPEGCLSLTVISISLILGICFIYITDISSLGIKVLLKRFVNTGQWVAMGLTIYLALELRRPDKGFRGAFLVVGFIVFGLLVLVLGKNYYSAKVLILTIVTMSILMVGYWRLKVTLLGALIIYLGLCFYAVKTESISLYPLFTWVFISHGELALSYTVILQQMVMNLAGLWGTGGAYIAEVGLVEADNMALNGIPYLALLVGNVGVVAYLVLLAVFMGFLLMDSFKNPSFNARGVALGLWCFIGINQYLSLFVLASPRILMIWEDPYGLPFIGSFQSGVQLLILAIVIVYRKEKLLEPNIEAKKE
jgi:hypothetical protein